MCKNSVLKKLLGLAALGAVIGGIVIFFKSFEKENDDLFSDDPHDSNGCPGCSDPCSDPERSYTTISGEGADAGQESEESPAESADEKTDDTEAAKNKETDEAETEA